MPVNNYYDYKKQFHLKYGRDPSPEVCWNAAIILMKEKFTSVENKHFKIEKLSNFHALSNFERDNIEL